MTTPAHWSVRALKAELGGGRERPYAADFAGEAPRAWSTTGSTNEFHRMATPHLVGQPDEEPDFDMDGDLWDYYYWRRQRQLAQESKADQAEVG